MAPKTKSQTELIPQAAKLIREGKLVAFPTETVYGLGANALDAAAVESIFRAKGRPSTSPLIVHVDSIAMAQTLVQCWPEQAEKLAAHFWPGPLTLILEKDPKVPDIVTAGLPTVGIRMPAHAIALELIRAAGLPIAAPSANPFTRVSATTAEHVRKGLGAKVDFVLDGGPTQLGIESTVLSLVGGKAVLLRPGMITRPMIEEVIGPIKVGAAPGKAGAAHASPGMHRKHYSPHTRVILGGPPDSGRGAYLWRTEPREAAKTLQMPASAKEYAAALYRVLHELDSEGFDWIAIEDVPDSAAWAAIRDRLFRAAAK
jgi:L-threonylcarbamoyladenylate synthase